VTITPSATIIGRAPVTAAVAAALAAGTGRPGDVGRPPKPAGTALSPELPYWILYPLPGGELSGTAAAPEADGTFVYQVTYVGARYDQIEQLADRGRQVMFARDAAGQSLLAPAGLVVMAVTSAFGFAGADFDGPVGSGAEAFAVHTTRA
jgi:hypothetical protein